MRGAGNLSERASNVDGSATARLVSISAADPIAATVTRRPGGWLGGVVADWDLLLLVALIVADVRVFQGSAVASFTLYELFAWGYCLPFVIGHALGSRHPLPSICAAFLFALGLYLGWLLLASAAALVSRSHSEVLQEAKNILPALPLACFLLIRIKRPETVARLVNCYLLYCLAAAVLAFVQYRQGGPYLRPLVENNDYKLNFTGDIVGNLVLGFSTTPNELAVVMLPGVMFSAVKLVHELREGGRPRILTLACTIVISAAFLLAQSRGAAVWLLFGFAFIVGPTRRSRSFVLKLTLVAGLIAVSVVYGLRVTDSGNPTVENTVLARVLLWKTAFDAMADDFYVAVLGDGMAYVKTWSWQSAGWEFPDAHNGWIDQALFFGLPALLFYLVIWRQFFRITDAAARSGGDQPLAQVLLDGTRASVLSFMGLYFFEPVAHAVFPVSQLFLLMSCGIGLAGLSADRPGDGRGSGPTATRGRLSNSNIPCTVR